MTRRSSRETRCAAESNAMPTHNTVTRTRADLYEEVWAEPLRVVAKRYAVSDVALGKICRKLRVPLPGRGYWARKASGKTSARPALPPVEDGEPTEVAIAPHVDGGQGRSDPAVRERVAAAKANGKIVVADKLLRPHALVAAAAAMLRGTTREPFGPEPTGPCLDIDVTRSSLPRALRIMDALMHAFDARGFRVEVVDSKKAETRGYYRRRRESRGATCVEVDGEWIVFALVEKSSARIVPPPEPPKGLTGEKLQSWRSWNRERREVVANGRLMLHIKNADLVSTRKVWVDGSRQRLEDCLGDFVAQLHAAAAAIRDDRLERERQHREWEEDRRRRLEAVERARLEDERKEALLRRLDDWRRARQIREYVADVRQCCAGIEREASVAEIVAELGWALELADRLDPLSAVRAHR